MKCDPLAIMSNLHGVLVIPYRMQIILGTYLIIMCPFLEFLIIHVLHSDVAWLQVLPPSLFSHSGRLILLML